jgi:hypothetical protein
VAVFAEWFVAVGYELLDDSLCSQALRREPENLLNGSNAVGMGFDSLTANRF